MQERTCFHLVSTDLLNCFLIHGIISLNQTRASKGSCVQSIHYTRSYLTGGCSNHLQTASSPQLDIVNLHRQSTAKEQCSILVKQQACLDGDSREQRTLPLGDLNEEQLRFLLALPLLKEKYTLMLKQDKQYMDTKRVAGLKE